MPAPPYKVKAVYEYRSEETDDLSFEPGQIITVTEDDEPDWYTGEYTNTSGDKLQGIFPRNFVEKYEPAIPSRPVKAAKRPTTQESQESQSSAPPQQNDGPTQEPASFKKEIETESSKAAQQPVVEEQARPQHVEAALPESTSSVPHKSPPPASKPSAQKAPPPVAEKSSSFKDRIAAFNKPAAAPVTPFKTSGQGGSTGFIKKPFVAPPPSKNSYIPPPREAPPQKAYRREEDPSFEEEERSLPEPTPAAAPVAPAGPSASTTEAQDEDQPKPTSLKERIALLQKQQLEQAARLADSAQKKDKPKKPPKKRTESSENVQLATEGDENVLQRYETSDTISKKSMDLADDQLEPVSTHRARPPSVHSRVAPPMPPRELVSDTNDADDSGAADTEDAQETSTEEERPKSKDSTLIPQAEPSVSKVAAQDKDEGEEDEEDTEEEEDPEIKRRRELRDRMAKMSGGMGMMGMFGPPMMPSIPKKTKAAPESNQQYSEDRIQEEMARAPPVPIMGFSGMAGQLPKRKEKAEESDSDREETDQPTPQEPPRHPEAADDYVSQPPTRVLSGSSGPMSPQERTAPPPPPREARGVPPPPPGARAVPPLPPQSPTARPVPPPPPAAKSPEPIQQESEDDEDNDTMPEPQSLQARRSGDFVSTSTASAPLPPARPRPEPPTLETTTPTSDKRTSRPMPPIPMSPTSPQSRAPPPPPPGQPPSRRSTSGSQGFVATGRPADEDSEEEVTEYDGDYDTDIASSAKHKDALKAHNRDSSVDDSLFTDETTKPPTSPPIRAVPPLPNMSAPRDGPPPPPPQSVPKSRKSTDVPRAAPPPIPAPKSPIVNDDYDPYRYTSPQHGIPSPVVQPPYSPPLHSPREEQEEEDMYGGSPRGSRAPPPPPVERSAPPPPPTGYAPVPTADLSRQSSEIKRVPTTSRRSMDQMQTSGEHGFIASDIDLGHISMWWTQNNLPPPTLQNRPDILFEVETTSSNKRGGKTMVSKDVYVLYQDYSQTTINASFDAADPSHVTLEQSHQRPPPPPRKDQLEHASDAFGAQLSKAASNAASSGSSIGDGSPMVLVHELVRTLNGALLPVGTRAYGALVYANLANASTQQFDEIRPGDIVSFRNAKFAGHKGGLHAKYNMDVGKPEHVGIVLDWDGTKKKIRAWEQGREEKGKKTKVKEESFRVGDLKSGEVRVWRVMPRSWVGWNQS